MPASPERHNNAMNAEFARRSVFVTRLVLANSFVSRNRICMVRKPGYR